MSLACKTALVESDVSHLIFPDDVQTLPVESTAEAAGPEGRMGDIRVAPSPESVTEAVDLIVRANRPIIIVGYGARHSMAEITALAKQPRPRYSRRSRPKVLFQTRIPMHAASSAARARRSRAGS